jgi:hypothetical protein
MMRRGGRLFVGREGGVRQGAMWGIRAMEREARQDFDDGDGMVVVELDSGATIGVVGTSWVGVGQVVGMF